LRILLVNWQDRLNPQAGGAEIHLHEIFGRLASGGAEVTLLASGWPGAPARALVDGMEVHRTARATPSAWPLRATTARTSPGAGRFDVVVEALNKVPVFTPLWADAPVVLLVHHLFGATAFREASLPVAALTWLLERPLGRVYAGLPVHAISRSTADDLTARGLAPADIRVIHPGVDVDFFTPGADTRDVEPGFLYLGRLKRYKGVDLAIRAMAQLAREGVPARLSIAGRGEWEPELRTLVGELGLGERVEFLGFVSEERKRELFRSAWANVFTSPKEGWGITNLEAAACGTATVASDSPGLRESVVSGETGLLVPHGDVAALAGALRRLASSREETERLGAGALRFSRTFTWERAAAETMEHLETARCVGAAAARHSTLA
jgi:glycosyltransferase involved in cell wall biosynthesis